MRQFFHLWRRQPSDCTRVEHAVIVSLLLELLVNSIDLASNLEAYVVRGPPYPRLGHARIPTIYYCGSIRQPHSLLNPPFSSLCCDYVSDLPGGNS